MGIYFGEDGFNHLSLSIQEHDKIFILTDEKIDKIYSSMLASLLSHKVIKIVVPEGEHNKTLENVSSIWTKLIENKSDRDSLMINFGGGTISDIGAFAASTFKRGINFINVPTTLLAMVDASIGGKNGINFGSYKNQIGLFAQPESILINTQFLKTLDERDILSGLAEMIKYAFIADSSFLEITKDNYQSFIKKAALLKDEIVNLDFKEKGLRKALNFGHTIGHAIESFCMKNADNLTHGESVSLGIYSALYLSVKYCNLDTKYLDYYEQWFYNNLNKLNVKELDIDEIIKHISHDKKCIAGKPRFVLISAPERPYLDVEVSYNDIKESILLLGRFLNY